MHIEPPAHQPGPSSLPLEFGYNPPTGARGIEHIDPATFVRDLGRVLDFANGTFDSVWISDHLMTSARFRLECWTLLTWIATRYPTMALGTNVISQSFRHAPLLAKMIASLQALHEGGFTLGYGAGWLEEEYLAYGYEFPPARTRIAQLSEAIDVLRAMWTQAPASYTGSYYSLRGAYAEPRPRLVPKIMIGGDGERYLLPLVAAKADIWFSYQSPVGALAHKVAVLQAHCAACRRDWASLRLATPLTVMLDKRRAIAEQRAREIIDNGLPYFAGDPAGLRDRLLQLIELGFRGFILTFADFPAVDAMRLFLEEVRPLL
jgi:alkanesulfonate monooxygenase SsuD/methylene tetrahydromethanopterin reductase-like flavin-dependent oxidoreductase (luciferase family)